MMKLQMSFVYHKRTMRFTTLSHFYDEKTKLKFPELGLGGHFFLKKRRKKTIGAFHFSLAVPVSDSVEIQVV
ncbi:hypothetical protein ANANG_G00117930 [Anguilla anguilla]|uniref:Uncharacterized protein n=2 Tax=Anguilla anguilla TaxID=7936 RepID=A0A9D3RXD1_ANGAN|nr:hypothetical protein ANANG_G00117930 [Anguilla anguilla]